MRTDEGLKIEKTSKVIIVSAFLVLVLIFIGIFADENKNVTDDSVGSTYETSITIDNTEKIGEMVWIPQTGKKYHSIASCSNMKNPTEVALSDAISLGYTACSKCY